MAGAPLPTVLDVDTGIDDALALLLALRSPELRLEGVTCVAGNVTLDQVVRNTLGVLDAAGAPDLPVAAGAPKPLARRLTTASFFHGPDGIGGVALPATERATASEDAATLLCRAADAHARDLCVVAVGPLTNIALACRRDPSLPRKVRKLVVMGGAATVPGNVTPASEANFYNDPEAADEIFRAGFDLTMVGLDVTLKALFDARRYGAVREAVATSEDGVARLAVQVLDFYLKADLAAGLEGSPLHDPLAVAVAALPDLVTCRPMRVEIEIAGRLTAGQSVANMLGYVERIESRGDHDDVVGLDQPQPNCRVAVDVDTVRFLELFSQRLGLDVGAPPRVEWGPI
ncbi:MAG TPA: nucleoside hydrolase [Chloroflexota bacterium]|nr:nucleoside hydrolase [Chloroflexota bacterium]